MHFNVTDLKLYFGEYHLQNLGVNSLQQGKDDAPMGYYDKGHVHELPKFKHVQEKLQPMRRHQKGQEYSYPGLYSMTSNFLTLVA